MPRARQAKASNWQGGNHGNLATGQPRHPSHCKTVELKLLTLSDQRRVGGAKPHQSNPKLLATSDKAATMRTEATTHAQNTHTAGQHSTQVNFA